MLQATRSAPARCYHCGLDVEPAAQFCAELNGETRQFCCPACRAVACTIVESGLAGFYRHQDFSGQAVDSALIDSRFQAFDEPAFQQQYLRLSGTGEARRAQCDLLIGGMHCAACVWLLERYLSRLPGIDWVTVNFSEQRATVSWQPDLLSLSRICQAIASLGYQPEPYSADDLAELRGREHRSLLRRLGVAGIAMMQVGMFAIALYAGAFQGMDETMRDFMRWVSLLVATPVVFYSAVPFFVGAWRGLRSRMPGMDVPVATAIGLAYSASIYATMTGGEDVYFDSVTMFTFLLLTGRYLELRARHRGGRFSSQLSSLLPGAATRLPPQGDEPNLVPLSAVAVGDRLRVKPGQVIPADGTVVSGSSTVDESQLTGEFMPLTRSVGDAVVAGSLNRDGVLEMTVSATGADIQLQSINELLNRAQRQKPRLAQLADRYASYFIVAVLGLAALAYGYWRWWAGPATADQALWVALSVLVVSCPCALSLATPTALTAATNRLRQQGILVADGEVWEKLPRVTDVVLDKTGTLTRGALEIAETRVFAEHSLPDCLAMAAALESYSEHPIAAAFTAGSGRTMAVHEVVLAPGQGIEGLSEWGRVRIGTPDYACALLPLALRDSRVPGPGQWVLLASERALLCAFRLRDALRDDAPTLVETLRRRGHQLHLLSGDSSGGAEQLAAELGLDACSSGASSADKLAYIRQLQSGGRSVMMLGDGINDVPVLAAADISVAMSNASNLAKTHADCVLLSGQLMAVATLLQQAAAARRVIRQNIAWALAYNVSAIPLAAMALVPPYLAALGMSLSSLVVVINALRLQQAKPASDDDPPLQPEFA